MKLDAREYKLLLDPGKAGTDPDAAGDFLRTRIVPLVADRAEGPLGGVERRTVRFLDTADRELDRAGLSLRRRRDAGEDRGKLTLKLRLADRFVVAGAPLRASAQGKDKFEEDIAPLEAADAEGRLVVASPPDLRSRFALAVDEPEPARLATVGDALDTFAELSTVLAADRALALAKGPKIDEWVLSGPAFNFGGSKARLKLTFWALDRGPVRQVVEVSWRCELDGGTMPTAAARAAQATFVALQLSLPVDLSHPSKTKLALP